MSKVTRSEVVGTTMATLGALPVVEHDDGGERSGGVEPAALVRSRATEAPDDSVQLVSRHSKGPGLEWI